MSRVSQMLLAAHGEKTEIYTVSPETSIYEAVRFARKNNVGALPVVREDTLVGIISERDFAYRILAEAIDPRKETVANFMSLEPDYVTPFTDLMDCLNLMKEKGVRHLPVVEKGRLVGIISLRDVLYVLLKNQDLLAQQIEAYYLTAM